MLEWMIRIRCQVVLCMSRFSVHSCIQQAILYQSGVGLSTTGKVPFFSLSRK